MIAYRTTVYDHYLHELSVDRVYIEDDAVEVLQELFDRYQAAVAEFEEVQQLIRDLPEAKGPM